MPNKTALTIIVSIILTVIIISLVNVGTNIILKEPEYDDFCPKELNYPLKNISDEEREVFNKEQQECDSKYRDAQKPYNQYKYYIFAGIGFILLLVGLFTKENLIQLTGLASGGILVAEGIIMNFENEVIVFFSLLVILIIFGIIAFRIIKKYK